MAEDKTEKKAPADPGVKRRADEEAQGFRGDRVDETPLEDYTVAGVTKKAKA